VAISHDKNSHDKISHDDERQWQKNLPKEGMTMRWLTACLLSCLLFVGCKHQTQTDANPTPPRDATVRRNPTREQTPTKAANLLEQGKRVYDETGCATCHAIGGIGGMIGPKLDGVGKKYDEAKLRQILLKPTTLNPNTLMPAFEGSEEDLEALVAYLKSLR
jgi:mono/diheme cytochrome c family protein